jgi:hypothetical protein
LTNPPRQNNPKQGITSQYRHEDYKPSRIQRRSPPSIGTGERRESHLFQGIAELRPPAKLKSAWLSRAKQFKTSWNKALFEKEFWRKNTRLGEIKPSCSGHP